MRIYLLEPNRAGLNLSRRAGEDVRPLLTRSSGSGITMTQELEGEDCSRAGGRAARKNGGRALPAVETGKRSQDNIRDAFFISCLQMKMGFFKLSAEEKFA